MINNTSDFLIDHFETALRIHTITAQSGLDDRHARLLVYVHVKTLSSPLGMECFAGDCTIEINALNLMLGTGICNPVNTEVRKAEFAIQERCGMESVLQPELRMRLRFHTDEAFRQKILGIYTLIIIPQIAGPARDHVNPAVTQQHDISNGQ